MSTSTHKLMAVCLVAVFSMMTYGCSSISKAVTTLTDEERIATVRTKAATAATAARTAATMAAALPNADNTATAAYITAAEAAATAAEAAKALADGATNVVAAEAAAAAAEAAKALADGAYALAKAANAAAAAAAAAAVRKKAAETKIEAIEAEGMQTTEAGIGGSGATTYSMTIELNRMGTTIKIVDSAMAGDDDPKFMQAMDLGGGRTMHVRAMPENDDGEVVEEVVIVSTGIEEPKATEFTVVYPFDAGTDDDPGDFDALEIDGDNVGMVALDDVSASTGGTLNFDGQIEDDASTTDVDESKDATEITGAFDGAQGRYSCTTAGADGCSVTLDNDGKITATSGWVFTPNTDETVDVPNPDYLYYGFWLKRTKEDGVVTSYEEVETFAGSSIAASDGNRLDSVQGSATYEGGATGAYVKKVLRSDGSTATATSGHFTADAGLKAYFGGTSIAADKHNTVEGSISNFALSGGEANEWSVNLKGARADGANTITGAGGATGGGKPGDWSGTFHGLTPETEAADDGTNRIAPGAVVGEFNANFSNGAVAGAFGARKQ